MHHRMPLSKTGWPSLNVVIFQPAMRLVLVSSKPNCLSYCDIFIAYNTIKNEAASNLAGRRSKTQGLTRFIFFNPYPANVENRVSS